MKPSQSSRPKIDTPRIVASSLIARLPNRMAPRADIGSHNGSRLKKFRVSLLIGAGLFSSGLFHLTLLWFTGADWSGPLSLRKPGLFGISAGVTVWSIVWVLAQLVPRRTDQRLASLMSGGLLVEVGLITMQQWRGVPSHFNRATTFDALVESIMLGLIFLVTAGIATLCWRSRLLRPMTESRAIAIRSGLWFLLASCGLGLLATIAGEVNLATGHLPEVWGRAGILKYPHGAALHAIQTLPLLSALLERCRVVYSASILRAAVVAQFLFLVHAVSQTVSGRARGDVDLTSVAALAAASLFLMLLPTMRPKKGAVIILLRSNLNPSRAIHDN